jgi:cytochrome c-type biogenesis protein CcsB
MILDLAYIFIAGATIAYMAHLIKGTPLLGRLGSGLTVAALSFLTIGLTIRTVEAGHWPLSNSYEFSLAFVWSILLMYLILERWMGIRGPGAFVLPIALLIVTYAQVLAPEWTRVARPLLPALKTTWLQLHVTTAAVAYGAFAVSCGAGMMYLVGETVPHLPENFLTSTVIDEFNFRALALGYPWMTLVLITGAIWAQIAWGSYWSWDIKETWTLATWLLYTLLFHLRAIRGWRGKPIASLSVLGFLFVLFTFLGSGWLARHVALQSLHLY